MVYRRIIHMNQIKHVRKNFLQLLYILNLQKKSSDVYKIYRNIFLKKIAITRNFHFSK